MQPAATAGADAGDAQQVLARFAGGSITIADFRAALDNKAPFIRAQYITPAGRQRMLREMVDYELLLQEAARRGYAERREVRDACTAGAISKLEADVAASIDEAALPESELLSHYEAHRNKYAVPAMRRASYVRVGTRALADALAARARAMPLDAFRVLAVKLDQSGQGSELGYVDVQARPDGNPTSAPLDAELVKQAFAIADVGKIAAPFPHGGGVVVMRLTAKRDAIGERFEEVVQQVREDVAIERRTQAHDALLERLRSTTPVVVQPDLSDTLPFEPAPALDIPSGFPAAPPDPTAPTIIVEDDGV